MNKLDLYHLPSSSTFINNIHRLHTSSTFIIHHHSSTIHQPSSLFIIVVIHHRRHSSSIIVIIHHSRHLSLSSFIIILCNKPFKINHLLYQQLFISQLVSMCYIHAGGFHLYCNTCIQFPSCYISTLCTSDGNPFSLFPKVTSITCVYVFKSSVISSFLWAGGRLQNYWWHPTQ